MKLKFSAGALAATFLLLQANASLAAPLPSVSSAARISNVQFHTVDLTPDDGQAGGLTQVRANGTLLAQVGGGLSDTRAYQAVSAATVAVANNFHNASASQSGVPGEMATQTEAHGYDWADASGQQRVDFILLAHTALSVTGHAAGFVHQDAGLPLSWGGSSADATLLTGSWDTLGYFTRNVSIFGPAPDPAYAEDFVVSYANNTDTAISLYWYTTVKSYADNGINSPVPEPETYAMLAAGLALIGLVARRRRRNRQRQS